MEDFDRHHRVNVLALFELLQAAVPGMAERGYGRVVNVASIAGKRPSLFNLAYATTKAAQLALARGFADAHASRGVTVNSVLPGPVDTTLWAGILEATAAQRGAPVSEVVDGARAGVPRGRFADPTEVAAVAGFCVRRRRPTSPVRRGPSTVAPSRRSTEAHGQTRVAPPSTTSLAPVT